MGPSPEGERLGMRVLEMGMRVDGNREAGGFASRRVDGGLRER